MVKAQQQLIPNQWLSSLALKRPQHDLSLIQKACDFYKTDQAHLLMRGIEVADILLSLSLDNETLAAAIINPAFQAQLITADALSEEFGMGCEKLLRDIQQMQAIDAIQQVNTTIHTQHEKIRKMLLSIVSDVRAVLIILAEHLWMLRAAKYYPLKEQRALAEKTLNILAPLANRLGVWQLKWEIEDLCLRYLEPNVYAEIARGLAAKRAERETFIQRMIALLTEKLHAAGVRDIEINGRVKHIYSIYLKMQRKNVSLQQIYDACALRVITHNIEDCYNTLSVLQNNWAQIAEEFDDYISKPKANGYRSIHTVIVGPDNILVEVQIRTQEMHQESELGVAAHWRYKEGILETSGYEAKIALLRQVMAWQKEIISPDAAQNYDWSQVFADRIYVFTPNGDVVDLPVGATPLDFAYYIHSEVGHRCRGAKIAGHIVPLTYQLKTGQCVEILTAKHANPSRDWLNPHAGYLKTARARAKAQHWFKLHDSDNKIVLGKEILDKEIKKLKEVSKFNLDHIAQRLNYKTANDLLIGLANGDASLTQIIHLIAPPAAPTMQPAKPSLKSALPQTSVETSGVNNVLTQIAKCCKPLPGDAIQGYISRHRGISIHRQDCRNLAHSMQSHPEKAMAVSWDKAASASHTIDLMVSATDSATLMQNITQALAAAKVKTISLQLKNAKKEAEAIVLVTIEIKSLDQLDAAIALLKAQNSIFQVERL